MIRFIRFTLLISFMLPGCCSDSPASVAERKSVYETWVRNLTDCPTAEVKVTSYYGLSRGLWDQPRTILITGCDLKICCNISHGGMACFSCKPLDLPPVSNP